MMKKIGSVLKYFILSLFLFFGGVLMDADAPSGSEPVSSLIDRLDDLPDIDPDIDLPDLLPDGTADKPQAEDSGVPDSPDQDESSDEDEVYQYYYSLLDAGQKAYYDQICGAVSRGEASIELSGITQEEADPIFLSVQYDHPEYFWLDSPYSYRSGDGFVEFIFEYNCEGAEKEKRQREIEDQADAIIAGAPLGGDEYEKIKYVFETIVDQTDYDLSAPDNQNIYSVFGNWTSVCAGYAKASKYLLDQLGVECIYVTGDASGEAHAWNIVRCDGQYYCYDATWGDPLYQEGIGVEMDTTSYEYLCCPDSMLSRTHTPDPAYTLPECTDVSLEYYRLAGRYLESSDREAILGIMRSDIDAGEERTDIQFASPDIYNEVIAQMDPLLNEAMQYEMEATGASQSNISYQYNDNTCRLTVLWTK